MAPPPPTTTNNTHIHTKTSTNKKQEEKIKLLNRYHVLRTSHMAFHLQPHTKKSLFYFSPSASCHQCFSYFPTTHIYNHAFGNSILCSKLFIDVFNFSKKNYSVILIQFCYLIIICSFIKK